MDTQGPLPPLINPRNQRRARREQIARWMGEARGWDRRRLDRETQEYLDEIALGQRFREHSA